MFFNRNSELNSDRMVIGIDIGRYSVQISYLRSGMDAPETAEQVTGSEVFNIPMVLCKRAGVNQWFYGREALKYHEKEGGYLVDGLMQKAVEASPVNVDGEDLDPVALLSLFLKRSLSILGGARISGAITDIMFTCEDLSDEVIDVMGRVSAKLAIKNCSVYFQSYTESIYSYMIHQEPGIWTDNVLVSLFDGNRLTDYVFKRNTRTSPVVTFVDKNEISGFSLPGETGEEARKEELKKLDGDFLGIVQNEISGENFSGVYLIGDGFKDNWCDVSLKYLGRNRRLFMGNDLLSRGACYSLMDKYREDKTASRHIYLGPNKLRCNVGMDVCRRGEDSYLALLDAGINWYDAKSETELFLGDDLTLDLILTPLDGGACRHEKLVLDNFPDRDGDTLRILLSVRMEKVNTIHIYVRDLGFGEMYPSSDMEWNFELEV